MNVKKKREPLKVGQRVKLRGRGSAGVLAKFGKDSTWVVVKWDKDGPLYVHVNEIEAVSE